MKGVDRDTFIQQNMGLVGMVVNKHANRIIGHPYIDRDDLESLGVIGLIKAYDRFDPSYEVQFSTYAVPMIDGEIKRYFRDNSDIVKFTRQSKIDFCAISEADLLNESPETIADTLEISIERVKNALDYYRCKDTDSLDREVHEDEGTPITLADRVGVEVDFDSNLEIELFLNKLDKRSRKIVELRLKDLSQAEIGEILGISQVQVSRTLEKIKDIYKGGNKVTEKNNVIIVKDAIAAAIKLAKETELTPTQIQKQTGVSYATARKFIKEHREGIEKKAPDYSLAQRLAEETELNPSQISKQSGVAYSTARKYVSEFRKVKEEIQEPVKVTSKDLSVDQRLDVPEEVASKPEINPADGYMTMTFKLTVEDATTQLEGIISAMKVLGFKDLNLTIQSQQVA